MSSLMTNASAMTALQTLRHTSANLAETQNRISTGYRVAGAEDNAAYWSIATTMRSDNMALSAVEDSLGLGAATVDVMYTAMDSTVDVMNEIKAKLVAARTPGVDRGKIQSDISELQNQLRSTADSAVFNGENWLASDVTTVASKDIVSSFTRAAGVIQVQVTAVDITATQLYDTAGGTTGILDQDRGFAAANVTGVGVADVDISAVTDDAADLTALEAVISGVDDALAEITDAATLLGSVKKRVDLQKDFVSALTDAIDRGVGQLVDADMNEESTRLQALQTQQQLGIQALSIANQGSQNILSLFR
ncbi:flagellin [Labrenzia sp. C1B10]|uniref:flagellin N-terminal helical domain-containing protein n=1 Tax=unclassified Labrenzia TaxID=2648686 RepID=UPI0003B856FE|nr:MULTISPECIES: flagellin [unclassified Labrenzia]ERP95740.1 flagellin [Labrenzia sp. C1B10]ERS05806.1 flagellin [Labrenzia sp. C1B70]